MTIEIVCWLLIVACLLLWGWAAVEHIAAARAVRKDAVIRAQWNEKTIRDWME